MEYEIAEIVIMPGQAMNRAEYLQALPRSVEFLGVPLWRSVLLLEKLLDDGDPELRNFACVALGGIFRWADRCLIDVVAQEGDTELQTKARELIQRNAKIRKNEEKELRLGPAIFFSRITYGGAYEARFTLERLLKHPDPIIREKASDLLKQMAAVGY